ncbi:AAA family ATPase [Glaesserella parasuis]|nr:AAA family ATPase [Glaesserella parasuis]
MQFGNFTLLEQIDSSLCNFATSAESYAYSDMQSSLIKLRCFAEKMVGILCHQLHIDVLPNQNLLDRMKHSVFVDNIPIEIQQKLHLLRMKGNKAAHGDHFELNQNEILELIRESYLLAKWFYLQQYPQASYPDYIQPVKYSQNIEILNNEILSLQIELEKLNQTEQEIFLENKKLKEKLSQSELELEREKQAFQYKRSAENIDLEQYKTLQNLKLQDYYNDYQLTQGQQQLVNKLEEFLVDRTQNVFLLRGYAGTGKTFIIKGLTDYLQLIGCQYMLSAPTGKASKVLANKTGKKASTIHSNIYNFGDLVEYRDENEPDTYKFYTNLKTNEDSSNTVYIVDEASMISNIYSDGEFIRFGSGRLLNDLIKYVNIDQNDHNKKLIFLGDNAQLPPIGMNFSPTLDSGYLFREYNLKINEFELTDVVRQKSDSGIIGNALKIRESLDKNEFNQLNFDLNANDIHEISEKDSIKHYLETCNHQINGESIIIAYSNPDVHSYNKAVRQYFFPNQETICKGDKIMSLRNRQIEELRLYNGDFGLVRQVAEQNEERIITLKRKLTPITLSFRDVEVGFRNENGQPIFIKTKIIENALYSDSPYLSSDEQKALYIDFCIRHPELSYRKNKEEFKNALLSDPYFNALPIKFGYAITCHKAQGSEWNNVFVKCNTHQNKLSQSYFRWIYTAITRAAKNLYLINPPKKKLGAGITVVGVESTPLSTKKDSKEEVIIQAQETQPKFDSSKLTGISKLIADKVTTVLANTHFFITQIEIKQYHDIYTISYEDQIEKFRIFYNAKNILTRIIPLESHNSTLSNLLEKLVDLPVLEIREEATNQQITFSQDFLNEFHHLILEIMKNHNLSILDAEEKQWNIRYTFSKGDQIAVLDIYFDSKHKFTKINPIVPKSTSVEFINEITKIIIEGLV